MQDKIHSTRNITEAHTIENSKPKARTRPRGTLAEQNYSHLLFEQFCLRSVGPLSRGGGDPLAGVRRKRALGGFTVLNVLSQTSKEL
jgi:hypothetical protein